MAPWDLNVQRMLDFIELHLQERLTLDQLARRLGYSPFTCTRQFQRVTGVSFRTYVAERRLSAAALVLRDADTGILELAMDWGFSSQEAFSRAFKRAFGLSPGAYRRCPVPLVLAPARRTLLPFPKDPTMPLQPISSSIQHLPAHRFLGLKEPGATDYMDFWRRLQARGLDCHEIIGLLDSLPSRNGQIGGWYARDGQIGGWYARDGQKGYLYGIEVPEDYAGPVPTCMTCERIEAGDFAVFHHPAYDFEREDAQVFAALHEAMAAWKAEDHGFEPDNTRPTYQRHGSDTFGQAFCRPVKQR